MFVMPPFHVWAKTGDGDDVRLWLCDTQRQANQLRDAIQEDIMHDRGGYVAAWVVNTHSDQN